MKSLSPLFFLFGCACATATVPIVAPVSIQQIPRTRQVQIVYDLQASTSSTISVSLSARIGDEPSAPLENVSGDVGESVTPGTGREIIWDAGAEWPEGKYENVILELTVDGSIEAFPGGPWALLEPGSFMMGTPADEANREDDELLHPVFLTRQYVMEVFEVTVAQFASVMNWALERGYIELNSSSDGETLYEGHLATDGDELLFIIYDDTVRDTVFDFDGSQLVRRYPDKNFPINFVTWYGAAAYCNFLSQREGYPQAYDLTDWSVDMNSLGYRLPTEAEWEYACRAGTNTVYSNGDTEDDLDAIAWYQANSGDQIPEVAWKAPNAFGLYDMHGSLFEWCTDTYADYEDGPVVDPASFESGFINVRGASFDTDASYQRAGRRDRRSRSTTGFWLGFRPVRNMGIRTVPSEPFSLELRDGVNVSWLWQSAESFDGGWRYFDWFGYFNELETVPWILHLDHGYMYSVGDDTSSFHLYDLAMGSWFWTSATYYPWLYKIGINEGWYFYYKGTKSTERWFYRQIDAFDVYEPGIDFPIEETVPNTPLNLQVVEVNEKRIRISWIDTSKVNTGIEIQYRAGIIGSFQSIFLETAVETSFLISNLEHDTPYSIRIRAYNDAGSSEWSEIVSARTPVD